MTTERCATTSPFANSAVYRIPDASPRRNRTVVGSARPWPRPITGLGIHSISAHRRRLSAAAIASDQSEQVADRWTYLAMMVRRDGCGMSFIQRPLFAVVGPPHGTDRSVPIDPLIGFPGFW